MESTISAGKDVGIEAKPQGDLGALLGPAVVVQVFLAVKYGWSS